MQYFNALENKNRNPHLSKEAAGPPIALAVCFSRKKKMKFQ
jgi:hypothetical protein